MSGIKLIQNGVVLATGSSAHPPPITIDVGFFCYLSFVGTPTPQTYSWSLDAPASDPGAVISSATSPGPTFLPQVDGGAYSVTLVDQLGNIYIVDMTAPTVPIDPAAGGIVQYVTTIATLRTQTGPATNATLVVRCYSTIGDGGGGTFCWDPTSTAADNGGTIIAPTGIATGRWKRQFSGPLDVLMFGARGDVAHVAGISITGGQNHFTASGLTAADIGKRLAFPRCGANDVNGHAVPMAGTITNVVGTTITVSFTASQSASSQSIAYGSDDTAIFQAAYDACGNGQRLSVPKPSGESYGITATWGGTKAIRIIGDTRGTSVLEWLAGPGAATNLIRLYGGGIYVSSIENLGFACQAYTSLDFCRVEDCTYFLARQLTFSSLGEGLGLDASNQTNGLHFKNLLTGQVPPRGNIRIADILYTHETGTENADGSHAIWVEGNAGQGFQQVTLEGEMNLEQAEYGIRLDYVSNAVIKCAGLIQGNRQNIGIYNGDHDIISGEVTCANTKRAVTLLTRRDIFVDSTCTNTQLYDPAANPAQVEINDTSHMWVGCETRLCNLPSPAFRGTTTVTGVNGNRYGAGGYTSNLVWENTLNDGSLSVRVSMQHSSVQRDVFEEHWDFLGNRQQHVLAGGLFSWFEGLSDDNTPMVNIQKAGVQSSSKTGNANVAARARFDALADTDEILFLGTVGSAQAVAPYQLRNVGDGVIYSVTKDGFVGASDGTTSQPGFFFQGDQNNGMMREGTDAGALIGGGNKMFRWTGTTWGLNGTAPSATSAAYTVTNPTTDRALNVTADTLAQGLQVLGTLIADLQAKGIIG